jgi:hypothetical protein
MFDFSILKSINFPTLTNIDFTNADNLWFLAIFLVIAIIILVVIITIIVEIINVTKKATKKIFNINVKRFRFNKKQYLNQSIRTQISGGIKNIDITPKQNPAGGGLVNNFSTGKKEPEGKQKDAVKIYKEKEEKSISEHLGKLKVDQGEKKDTLESKMPSRSEKKEEGNNRERIKIAVPKHFSTSGMASADFLAGSRKDDSADISHNSRPLVPPKKMPKGSQKNADSSMFEGESGVSRTKLEHGMKADPKIWQASRQSGLNLSPVERAKLMKEVFSPALGRNISKTDLQWSIKKLNQKMLSTKDPQEHAKIRKEIAFFKNIANIK